MAGVTGASPLAALPGSVGSSGKIVVPQPRDGKAFRLAANPESKRLFYELRRSWPPIHLAGMLILQSCVVAMRVPCWERG
jgi:hypothetical protein